jgi:hypothetical protein
VPAHFHDGETPVIRFDPQLEISPFALFRRLQEGDPPLLVDVRPAAGELSLAGANPWCGLQAAGHRRVRALFGGLELYDFALDPAVVGAEVFLVRRGG